MLVKIIKYKNSFKPIRIPAFHKGNHLQIRVALGLERSDRYPTPSGQWFDKHKDVCDTRALVFVVKAFGGQRLPLSAAAFIGHADRAVHPCTERTLPIANCDLPRTTAN